MNDDLKFDICVIGAGIVGLAITNLLTQRGHAVLLVEQNEGVGAETSSRNSGVIHGSLYYPGDSLKARSCTRGRHLLYERCSQFNIPHRKVGKLVVASSEDEKTRLEELLVKGTKNGAEGLRLLSKSEVQKLEPDLQTHGALWSPETGIVDAHALMLSHKKEAEEAGAVLALRTKVRALEPVTEGWALNLMDHEGDEFRAFASIVVNAAGLQAQQIASLAGIEVNEHRLQLYLCKGDYFSLSGKHRGRINRLVYPLPVKAGLGIHLTLDLDGQLTAGPDTEYVDDIDYTIREEKRRQFAEAVRRYFPAVQDDDLSPGYSGIRPKLQGPGDSFRDFEVLGLDHLGAPRMIGLFGIESPGLTASEALAEMVVEMVRSYR